MVDNNDHNADGKRLSDVLNRYKGDGADQSSTNESKVIHHNGSTPKQDADPSMQDDQNHLKLIASVAKHHRNKQKSPAMAPAPSSQSIDEINHNNLHEIWENNIIFHLSGEVNPTILHNVFRNLTPYRLQDHTLTLIAEKRQAYMKLDEAYKGRIMRAFHLLRLPQFQVNQINVISRDDIKAQDVKDVNKASSSLAQTQRPDFIPSMYDAKKPNMAENDKRFGKDLLPLNNPFDEESAQAILFDKLCFPIVKEQNFDNFVIDSSNKKAYMACLEFTANVLQGKAQTMNIHGETSIGKTHLLNGCLHALIKANPKLRILFCKSNLLKYGMAEAMRDRTMPRFRSLFRNIDVLVLDDAHHMPHKGTFIEELFHIIAEHQDHGRALICASQYHPTEIIYYPAHLRSRLQAGLCIPIHNMRHETTLNFLRDFAQSDPTFIHISEENIRMIAHNTKNGIRAMTSQIQNIKIHFRAHDILPSSSPSEVARAVRQYLNLHEQMPRKITAAEIMEFSLKHFHITKAELLSRQRTYNIKQCRHVCMYLMRQYAKHTYPMIAKTLGGLDHSTVMHGSSRIAKLIESDPAFRLEMEELIDKIKQSPPKDWS